MSDVAGRRGEPSHRVFTGLLASLCTLCGIRGGWVPMGHCRGGGLGGLCSVVGTEGAVECGRCGSEL